MLYFYVWSSLLSCNGLHHDLVSNCSKLLLKNFKPNVCNSVWYTIVTLESKYRKLIELCFQCLLVFKTTNVYRKNIFWPINFTSIFGTFFVTSFWGRYKQTFHCWLIHKWMIKTMIQFILHKSHLITSQFNKTLGDNITSQHKMNNSQKMNKNNNVNLK